jgi:hypothetical protein
METDRLEFCHMDRSHMKENYLMPSNRRPHPTDIKVDKDNWMMAAEHTELSRGGMATERLAPGAYD